MSQPKFTPRVEELVPASSPHPPNTFYRVAIGSEDWEGLMVEVEKVQMVYGGRVAGRKAPSFPAGSEDAERVRGALERMRKQLKGGNAPDREQTLADMIGSARGIYGSPDDVQRARDELRREWP